MSRNQPSSTVRSELQTIGRTLDDPPHHEAATDQALQTIMPWVWLEIGIVVAMMFACLVTLGPPPASQAAPTQSMNFNTLARQP